MNNEAIRILTSSHVLDSIRSLFLTVTLAVSSTQSLHASDYYSDEEQSDHELPGLQLSKGLLAEYVYENKRHDEELLELQRKAQRLKAEHEEILRDIKKANEQKFRIEECFTGSENLTHQVALRDIYLAKRIEKLGNEKDVIFLAIGNPLIDYNSPQNMHLRGMILSLLETLRNREVFIIYDADSMAAYLIENQIPPEIRLGITGKIGTLSPKRGKIVLVHNPYRRMKMILSFKHIVLSPDSLLSAGLLIEESSRSYSKYYYILGSDEMKNGLYRWSIALEQKSNASVEISRPWSSRLVREQPRHQYEAPKSSNSSWYSRFRKKKIYENEVAVRFNGPTEVPKAESPKENEVSVKMESDTKVPADGPAKESPIQISAKPQDERIIRYFTRTDFRNLGISYSAPQNVEVVDPSLIGQNFQFIVRKKMPANNISTAYIEESLDQLGRLEIRSLIKDAQDYAAKEQGLRANPQFNANARGGAVLFGSGKGCSHFEPLVEGCIKEVARAHMPVSTGGEAGFMEIANKTAYRAGAYSVGITLGKNLYPSPNHHETIVADGYEQRIPLLLYRKILIMFAPGGHGTMKELATTFVKMAAETRYEAAVAFLSADYYGGLLDWLHSFKLPEQFWERVSAIDSVSEMKNGLSK